MKKELRFSLILSLFSLLLLGQTKNISGSVTDENGLGLPGVSVIIQGTANGTVTDFDGNYVISASLKDRLSFSYTGYQTQKVSVGGNIRIDIILKPNDEILSEVVVTGFGIKRNKSSLGAATQTIRNAELTKGTQSSIGAALKGKVPGAIISTASTDPGASTGIILRGYNSILAGSDRNQPLIILNGVPINNESAATSDINGAIDFGRGIDDLNPEDIESIDVIKGTSASSIYGSRAANGVVVITTKKGSKGLKVDIASKYTITDILRTPRYQSTFGQGFGGLENLGENVSYGPRFNGQERLWGNEVNNSQLLKPFLPQRDQLRNFFDHGHVFTNNVAISGGIKNTTGRLSFARRKMDGIYPDDVDTNTRNTLGLNLSSDFDWFKIAVNANYVDTDGKGVVSGQGKTVYNNLLQIPRDLDISGFQDLNNPFNTNENYFTRFALNPYWVLKNRSARLSEQRFYGSIATTFTLSKGLHLTYRGGLDNTEKEIVTFAARDNVIGNNGFFAEADIEDKQINHNLVLEFKGKFNKDWSIDTNIGLDYNQQENETQTRSVATQDEEGVFSLDNSTAGIISGPRSILGAQFSDFGKSEIKRIGIFNTATFNYKDLLFFTGNTRVDWSSTIPVKNRPALYGGVNGAWIFTKHFTDKSSPLSFGKLRIGYGETGVDAPKFSVFGNNVQASADLGFSELIFPINGLNAVSVGNRLANPDLKSERKKEFEIGTELSFFKNRVRLDATIYRARVEGLIASLSIAPSLGESFQVANFVDLRNQGVETLLSIDFIKNYKGFSWSTAYNFAAFDSEVEEINASTDRLVINDIDGGTSLVAREGSPLLLEGNAPLRNEAGQIVVDRRGIPIRARDTEIYGDTEVDYTIGLTNTFKYKGLTFEFSIDSRQGGLMYSRTAEITRFSGNSIASTFNDRKPFIVPNSVQNIGNEVSPVYVENTTAISGDNQFEYNKATALDSQNVISKSFVKLREVILSYDFNKQLFQKLRLPIEKLSLSVVGRDLLLWTPSSNQFIDPEVSTFGTGVGGQLGEFSANPTTRSLSFQLKAQF